MPAVYLYYADVALAVCPKVNTSPFPAIVMDANAADGLLNHLYGLSIVSDFKIKKRKPPKKRPQHFRFFDLPQELRDVIYSLVVLQSDKATLQNLELHGICQLSRQLRQESLPVYFKLNTFILEVVGSAAVREVSLVQTTPGIKAHFLRETDDRINEAGVLKLNPGIESLLGARTPEIFIRIIDIVPLNFVKSRGQNEHLSVVLSLRMPGGASKGEVSVNMGDPQVGSLATMANSEFHRDLTHLSGPAERFLPSFADRDTAKGLSFSALTALARTFMVLPRTDAEGLTCDILDL